MKGIFSALRAASVLIAASASLLGLASCGGSSVTNVSVGGTITGLTTGPLILSNGLTTTTLAAGTTTFTLPSRVTVGYSYNVYVYTQPPAMTCVTANGSGQAKTVDITDVVISCATNNILGGKVSGLKNDGLVLTNGSDTVAIAANATSFVFPTKTVAGTVYGATILSQPAGQVCTLSNGSGTMGSADINSIQLTCI